MPTLGCAQRYHAIIHYQGGDIPFYQVPQQQMAELTWQRILDETSKATLRIKREGLSEQCCKKLGRLDCWGFELSIYRDDALVWQGPIYDILEDPHDIYIEARDVIGYLDHRANNVDYNATNLDLGLLFGIMVLDGFSLSDPNVTTYMDVDAGIGPPVDWFTEALTVYVGDEIREIAKAGYDFTTMGRAIIGREERTADEYTERAPILTQQHFAGQIQLKRVGAETVTRAIANGNAVSSVIGGPVDPFYGVVDVIEKFDQVTDVNFLARVAEREVNEGHPTPSYIVFPSDGKLLPSAPITVEQLMCGERIDVYVSGGFCRTVQESFKLVQVNATWGGEAGESIGISLGPLPTDT